MLLSLWRKRIHVVLACPERGAIGHREKLFEKEDSHELAWTYDDMLVVELHELIEVLNKIFASDLFIDEIVFVEFS